MEYSKKKKEMLLVNLNMDVECAQLYLCLDPEEIHDGKNDTEEDIVELLCIVIRQAITLDNRRRLL